MINQSLFEWIFQFAYKNAFLDGAGIFIAAYVPYLLVIGFFILLFQEKNLRSRAFLFSEAALAVILARGLITEVIRFFYVSPRPEGVVDIEALITETANSFPSGHMAFYFALVAVIWYVNQKWAWWYGGLTVLVGIARIFVGVHWPLDILGGIVIGILSGMIVHLILKPYRLKPKPAPSLSEEIIA